MVKRRRRRRGHKNRMSGQWCGAFEMPYDWRKPNRLNTLQIGETANDQTVFPVYSVPMRQHDGGSESTNLAKRNNFGREGLD